MRPRRWAVRQVRADRGSGSVLTVAIVGAVAALTSIAIPSYMGLATRQTLTAAADAAALAAADASTGAISGEPCGRAGEAASANGARLARCELDGYVATVLVSRTILGIRVSASATAGPPQTVPD